jgi:hypothetical protein
MMSVAGKGPERVAEILREILALSGTKRPNQSESAAVGDSIKLFERQSASGIHLTSGPHEKETSEKRKQPEDQNYHG